MLLDSGECRVVAADPAQYRELGRFQACGKSYVHPALARGVLYVRDARELVAYCRYPLDVPELAPLWAEIEGERATLDDDAIEASALLDGFFHGMQCQSD